MSASREAFLRHGRGVFAVADALGDRGAAHTQTRTHARPSTRTPRTDAQRVQRRRRKSPGALMGGRAYARWDPRCIARRSPSSGGSASAFMAQPSPAPKIRAQVSGAKGPGGAGTHRCTRTPNAQRARTPASQACARPYTRVCACMHGPHARMYGSTPRCGGASPCMASYS